MTPPIAVHLHIAEPWDFEREAGTCDLYGRAAPAAAEDEDAETDDALPEGWFIALEAPVTIAGNRIDRVFVDPRYHGERLEQIEDPLASLPVNVAYRAEGEWHFAIIGTLSLDRRTTN